MDTLRVALIGLGWMGWLYDVATRPSVDVPPAAFPKGMPPLRPDRDAPPWAHPGREGLPSGYADSVLLHPRLQLTCACEPDEERLIAFGQRYPGVSRYRDYRELFEREKVDVVGISTRTDTRPAITRLAIQRGARGIFTEKPMAFTLAEADQMVDDCARAGVPLVVGAIGSNHPSFEFARALLDDGGIGQVLSLDASTASGQHCAWNYLIDSDADWVVGSSETDLPPDDEFGGCGLIHFTRGIHGLIRQGAPGLRITGTTGEIIWDWERFRIWKDVEAFGKRQRVEVEWPGPNMRGEWSPLYGFQNLVECIDTDQEPRVSGRRVRRALEIQIALRESHRKGNVRVNLPLNDRSLGMRYAWFR